MKPPRYSQQARYPRYPQPRRKRWIFLALLALVFIGVLKLGYGILSSGSPEELHASLNSTAHAAQQSDAEIYPNGPLAEGQTFDRLLLEKSERRLTAFSKGTAVRIYYVALGTEPVGRKQFEGDRKTPEGTYTINDKNPNSAYYKNLGISYPNKADRDYARKQNKKPGGDIKIHGLAPSFAELGAAHRLTDWTYGCIAVTNPEIDELFTRTPIGTPIEIVP